MTEEKYVIRLSTVGGNELEAALVGIGNAGEKNLGRLGKGVFDADKNLSALAVTVGTRMAAAFSAPALLYGLKNLASEIGHINDTAKEIGVTTDFLQEFRYVAVSFGNVAKTGDDALSSFTQKIGEAQAGLGKLLPILRAYGVELRDSAGNNRSVNEILFDYIDAIKNASDAQSQLLLAQKAFGEGPGKALLEAFRSGSDELVRLRDEAHTTGNVLDKQLIEKADAFDEAWDKALYTFENRMKGQTYAVLTGLGTLMDALIAKAAAFADEYPSFERWAQGLQNDIRRRAGMTAVEPVSGADPTLFAPMGSFDGPLIPKENSPPVIVAGSSSDKSDARHIKEVIELLKFRNEQLQRTNEDQELYNQLRAAGVSIDSAAGQEIKAQVEQYNSLTAAQKEQEAQTKKNKESARELGLVFKSAFEDAIVEGKSFGDVLKGLEQDIIRIMMRKVVTEPLSEAFGGFMESFDLGNIFSTSHHTGGLAGRGAGRMVSAEAFLGAPRLHGGGIVGLKANEVPTILERGEGVFTKDQMAALGSRAKVEVKVIDQAGVRVEARESPSGDSVEITLKRAVKNMIAGGDVDEEMGARYGVARTTW